MLHRAQFHNVLLRHIPDHVGMHTTKRLTSFIDPGDSDQPIRLQFADETEATCDILVGADGFRSAVRVKLFSDIADTIGNTSRAEALRGCIPPRHSGAITYRTVIPREKLTQLPHDYTGWSIGKIVRKCF